MVPHGTVPRPSALAGADRPSTPQVPAPAPPRAPAPVLPGAPVVAGPGADGELDHRAAVRGVLAALDGLADRPLPEHAPVFDDVRQQLQGLLARLDG